MSSESEARTERSVRISRLLPYPVGRVFAAWTDPASLARWLSPTGRAIAVIDPRPGGRLRVTMVGDGMRIEHTGVYREVLPDRRLVFTWQSPYTGPGESIVTVELEPRDGGTHLTLTHGSLPDDQVDPHADGWARIIERLVLELDAVTAPEVDR